MDDDQAQRGGLTPGSDTDRWSETRDDPGGTW